MQAAVCLLFFLSLSRIGERSEADDGTNTRYLLYSVNPGEGFNLRRDVHMRAATLVKDLHNKGAGHWVLVLLPWPRLYHWRSSGVEQMNRRWGDFFDLQRLNEYVPTIEFHEYIEREGRNVEEVIWLQHFDRWDKWEETLKTTPCSGSTPYVETSAGGWRGAPFGLQELKVGAFRCVSVMGYARTLLPELLEKRSVLVEHFEVVMHSSFGGVEYWKALWGRLVLSLLFDDHVVIPCSTYFFLASMPQSRASMVYAEPLRAAGNVFMRTSLNYDPGGGDGRQRPLSGGGNYLAVHLRRRDYKQARPDDIPSLEGATEQINILKQLHDLELVFLATDSPIDERRVLAQLVEGVVWYTPTEEDLHRYGDGGVAIIDQWIASHAKFFVGSYESTFSFRIREDRQLMGFSKESTYNTLCGRRDNESDHTSCATPTYWAVPRGVVLENEIDRGERTEL